MPGFLQNKVYISPAFAPAVIKYFKDNKDYLNLNNKSNYSNKLIGFFN